MDRISRGPQFGDSDEAPWLPPWLQGVPLPPRPPSRAIPPDEADTTETEAVPDWLQGATTASAAADSDPFRGAETVASSSSDSAIPDWLRDLQSDIGAAEEDQPLPVDDQPDWLASLTAEQPDEQPAADAAPPAMSQPDDSELPDWLRSSEQPEQAPPADAAPTQAAADEPADQTSSWAQMPVGATDWLRSLGQEDATESAPASAEQPEVEAPAAAPSDPTHTTGDSGVPDWLRDISPDEVARDIAETTPESSDTPPPAETDSSDWMVSGAASVADAAQQHQEELSEEPGIPDWLRDISPDEVARDIAAAESDSSAMPPSEQPPDWFAGAGEPAETRPASEEAAGIPDWLRDVSPDEVARDIAETGSDMPAAPPSSAALPDWLQSTESSGVTDAEIPDWLQGESAALPEETAPTTPAGEPEIPSWLTSSSTEEAPSESGDTSDWFEQPATSPGEPEVPSWLGDSPTEASPTEVDSRPDWFAQSEVSSASAEPEEAAIPGWLQGVDEPTPMPDSGETGAPAAETSETDAEETPNWLQSRDAPSSRPETGSPVQNASTATELPDWLADMGTADAAVPQEDLPSWLRADITAESGTEPPRITDVVEKEELPDWLADDTSAKPASEVPAARPDDSKPDWLRDAPPADAPPAADEDIPEWLRADAPPADVPPAADEDIPEWLRGGTESTPPSVSSDTIDTTDLPPWMVGESDDLTADLSSGGGLPAWLQGADTEAETPSHPPSASPLSPSAESDTEAVLPSWLQDEQSDEDIPEWLREEPVAQVPAPAAVQPPDTTDESSSFLGGADLPDWLRPTEPEPRVSTRESQQVDWLSSLGAGEEESEVAAVARTEPTVLPRPTFTHSPAQMQAAALLQDLVAHPFPETNPASVPAEPAHWRRLGLERMLYIVLALALLVGVLIPSITGFLGATSPSAPTATDLATIVSELVPEDVVLVAYEWDAQRSSELRPLETAVTQHLIEQNVRFVVLSTDPQGTLLSFNFRDPLRAAGYNQAGGGQDYVLMGYQPGGEFALRRLVQQNFTRSFTTFSGEDATVSGVVQQNELETIADFALILVMADQPQDVQGWIEQVHTSTPDVPMAFLLPFETAPVVQPYLRYPNVYQLVGRQGALDYMAAYGGGMDDITALRASGLQHFAALVFVVLIIVGVIAGLLLQPKRPAESEE